MPGKLKKSVLVRVNVIIAVIIICVIAMLAYSNIKAIRTIRDKAEKTYQSMGEYYANDLKANLNSIAEYLLRVSDTSEYYNVAYSGKNSELINALAKQKLYNRLNDDILVYRPADYFFTYRKADSALMLVASALKSAKTPNWEIKDQLALLMSEGVGAKDLWKFAEIDGNQYLIKTFESDAMAIGSMISLGRLIETIQAVNLSEYYVYYTAEDSAENRGESRADLVVSIPVSGTDSQVNITIPGRTLYEEIRSFTRISMIFGIVLLILLPLLCIAMYRWFIQPIRLTVRIMKRVDEEGMELRMPNMDNMGEYQIVGSAFNNMMEKISRLKIDVYEKEKKEQELYEQCSRLQINPHFFLNALNTVYLLNKRKDSSHVQMMLTWLINYFKHVFSGSGDMVLLRDEVDFTLNYMAIQRQRYAGSIHFRYEIDKDAELCRVPSMCILTFVENSIKYAADFTRDLLISVTAKLKDRKLCITVEDDGAGMPEDILHKLERNEKIIREGREHIGIQNIKDRLRIHYQDCAALVISNKDSGGALIRMELPAERRTDESADC